MTKIDFALTTFGEVDNTDFGREHEAQCSKGAVFDKQKSLFPKNPAYLTANSTLTKLGFVVSAVLHTIVTSLNRLHGTKDRLNRLPAQIPRSGKLSDYTSLQVQKRASPTCNRTEQLPMVSVAGNSGTS